MDINSTSASFSFRLCYNGTYAGMTGAYVAVCLCFFVGTPAHSWLLWLYLHAGSKIKPTQVFPLNLTMLELIYCIQGAVQILNILIFTNDTLMILSYIFFGLSWVGRPLMQICICVEQYLAVLYPVMFIRYKGLQYRIVVTAVVWLIMVACSLFEMFIDSPSDHMFNSVFFTSMIVALFCCVSVLRALKQPGPGDTQISVERGRDVGNQQKRNAFNTIFSGLLIILFTYLPQVLGSLIHVKQKDEVQFYCNTIPVLNSFNFLGVMMTPYLKLYKNGEMKCLTSQRHVG